MDGGRPVGPGAALTRFLFVCGGTYLFWLWASTPGWEIVWLGVVIFGIASFTAFLDLIRAHRAWNEWRKLEKLSRTLRHS